MNTQSKDAMRKYLKFQYWTRSLYTQGLLSQREYHRLLCKVRTKCGIC